MAGAPPPERWFNISCLFIIYETEREEDSRYRNNKHDYNC